MEFDLKLIDIWLAKLIFPLFRISAMFGVMPLIGTRLVPQRIKIGLALCLTIILIPNLPEMPPAELNIKTWIEVVKQVFIGMAMGFTLYILMESFVVGGQLIANQMGLGFASMADPTNGTNVAVISQFLSFMVLLLFLAVDGHLLMFKLISMSFVTFPVGGELGVFNNVWNLVTAGAWLFSAGLLMAIPSVTAILIVNFSFGIMTKAAPQLNIFSIGFPFTMLLGLLITYLSFGGFVDHYFRFSEDVLNLIGSLFNVEVSNG